MINEATLIGRIGKKDIRDLKNGTEMATLYMATAKKWVDTDGVMQEKTVWHNVNFFGKLPEIIKKYAHVGDLVYIRGEINHKQIVDGDKKGQWSYSITGSQIKFLSSSKRSAEKEAPVVSKPAVPKAPAPKTYAQYEFDDQIPF